MTLSKVPFLDILIKDYLGPAILTLLEKILILTLSRMTLSKVSCHFQIFSEMTFGEIFYFDTFKNGTFESV